MRKLSKTLLSLLLIAAMLASFVVLPAAAEEPAAEQPTEAVQAAETQAADSSFMKIFHLDCGRKYFTKDWILALINEISAAGYTHLQLAIGNDGMRFLLDDMSLTVGDKTYSSEDVAAAIHAGNVAYDNRQSYTPEKDELTESEMNAIISYAASKGITVIPLINNPGHMDAILSAATSLTGTSCSYNRSVTTIDLGNEDAVAFTKAFLTKYVKYFAAKGCTHFGIGADEYANDVYSTGSMGFGKLVKDGNYDKFISYVNSVAALVKAAKMKPVAFNDGFYFNGNTTSGTFSTDIVISFWTSGWGGYQSETASQLAARGHQMINTNGDFYYVLGKSDKFDSGYDYASNFSNTAFMGSTVSNPAGATFCVWCDYPGAETEQEIAQKIRLPLRAMAQRMKGESVVLDENELVSGGFKADGTINVATNVATVSDKTTGVSVTAPGLTGIKAEQTKVGEELDGKKVAGAWNIELTTANGSYTDSATVSIPVGEEWLSYKLTGGVLESDGTTVTSDPNSKVENGVLTFTAPHFSTVVVLAEEKQVPITVTVGRTETITVDGEVSSAYTDNFVTVKTETQDVSGDSSYEKTQLSAGTFYVSANSNATKPAMQITLEDAGDGQYYVKNAAGQYVYPYAEHSWSGWSTSLKTGKRAVTIKTNDTSGIALSIEYSGWTGLWTTYAEAYLVVPTSGSTLSVSTTETYMYLYKEVTTAIRKQTTISFTGKKAGTTQVKIGDVLYIITVSPENLDNVSPLKIEYWITNSRLTGTTSSKNELSIAATLDGVASAEGVEIASLVDAQGAKDGRTQEYWQSKILDVQKSNDSTSGTELQTTKQGDDETLNGTAFTKARYWDGKWQVFTNAWVDVDRTQVTVTDTGDVPYKGDRNQLVAYYMEVVSINNENGESELHVNAADWGTKGDGTGSWGYPPESSRCSVSIQLVYEDGSFNPTDTTAAKLKSKTILYGYWSGGRGLGTMVFTGQQGYEIYKVTAATGTMASRTGSGNTVTVTDFTWADNEETVWEGNQTKSVSIGNPARKPSYEAPYDNLAWNTGAHNRNNAILIRVYVKAEIKEDSLKVHYVNLKGNSEFYTYAINVPEGTTFDSQLAMDPASETYLVHNTVVNTNGIQQTVNGNLSKMAEIGAQYRYGGFTLKEVKLKNGNKEAWLYYDFQNEHVFVVDFGVPVRIMPSDINVAQSGWSGAKVDGKETSVGKYGTATVGVGKGLTYTATKPMQGVETFTVTLEFTDSDNKITGLTYLIYLVPATTVYYEQNVATYSDGWNSLGTIAADKYQQTQKGRTTGYNFGYDSYYEANQLGANGSVEYTTTPGESAQLTFKGTGMELYLRTQNANATSDPATEANNATDHSYMLVQVYAGDTADANNLKRMSFVDVNNLFVAHGSDKYGYNTPCWTVDGMAYDTYTVVVRYVKGTTYGLAIDGFRVTNTLNPDNATTKDFYAAVHEDNMQTSEIRNMVLAQANVSNAIFDMSDKMYRVGVNEVLDAVFDDKDVISGATIIDSNGTVDTNVTVDENLVNIGPKNEIYLKNGQAVVMQIPSTYSTVQVGMRSLTGTPVQYKINTEEKTMNSTVDMYYKVSLAEGKLVIQNVSGGILALTKLKVTGAGTTTNDVSVETTPEAIRYAMALMRGLEVPQFTDVPEGAWYHDYVYDLVYRSVVNGMTATTYEPEGKLTRAQFVKLLACSLADAETLKTYEGRHPFKDSEGHWAEAYIAWAKDKGIVEGVSATEFDPEAPITREQMATIFGRYALKQGIELPKSDNAAGSFPDADKISEYAREFVELMRIAGILNGYEDGTFRPQGNATRAEAAKLFSLFLSITDKLAK